MTTKFALAGLMGSLNALPTKCTIKGRYHTHIFRLPNAFLKDGRDIDPIPIAEREKSRATVVSDLQSYFQKHSPFCHYSITNSFESQFEEVVQKSRKNSSSLFVVIEQEIPCETTMDDGTCFILDEKSFKGALPGEVIVVGKTLGGIWPEYDDGNEFVNTILAALKVEQDTRGYIEELFSASCFFDMKGRAIYSAPGVTLSEANLRVESPMDGKKLKEKTDRLKKLIDGFEADMQLEVNKSEKKRTTSRLINALRLDRTNNDYYRRTWYLRLYEAMLSKLTGKPKDDFTDRHRNTRVDVGHPYGFGKIDIKGFNYLQTDVLEEVRCIYLKSDGNC